MIRIITAIVLSALVSSAQAQVTAALEQIKSEPAKRDVAKPRLKREANISGDIVRIGDLVENAGIVSDVPIFRSPDLGETGLVPVGRVLDAVRPHALIGLDTAGITEVVVNRLSREIPIKSIEQRIAKAIAAQYTHGPVKNLAISFIREPRAVYVEPSAKGELRIANLYYDPRSTRFDVTFEPPSEGARTLRFSGNAVPTVEALVVTRAIGRGEVLKNSDVTIERRAKSEVERDREIVAVTEPIIGLASRRALSAGQVIRTSDLTKPELVARDAAVTLVYEVPGITLTMRGKALESGSEGDVINVLNTQSKRTVQGTITASGRIVVGGQAPRRAASLEPTSLPSNAPADGAE